MPPKNSKPGNTTKNKNKNPSKRIKAKRSDGNSTLEAGWAHDYLTLLRDPCAAKLVPAPYAGAGSSLLVRTVTSLVPTSVGNHANLDFGYEITPWNFPNLYVGGCAFPSANWTNTATSTGGFLASTTVKSFRPVAACVKWVPTGAMLSRTGLIGMGYSNSKVFPVAGLPMGAAINMSSMMLKQSNQNAVEMKWLPGFEDARMSTVLEPNVSGAGSIQIIGQNIDGTYDGTTSSTASGFIEITTVWEWEPYIAGSGIVPAPTLGPKFTINSVLGSIGNIGEFLIGNGPVVANTLGRAFRAFSGSSYPRLAYR